MSTQRNPLNVSKVIDLGSMLDNIQPAIGLIDDSGLYEESGMVARAHMYKIVDQAPAKTTPLTSRTERNTVALDRPAEKWVTMAGVSFDITGGVQAADLADHYEGVFELQSETVQEAVAKELRRMANTGSANMEYLKVTGTQGVAKDPRDGTGKINAFTNNNVVRTTHTITAAPTADIIGSLVALQNKVATLNGYHGNITEVEVRVADDAFNAIVTHPDLLTMYQLAGQGGKEWTLNNKMLNGQMAVKTLGLYGFQQEFRWGNLVFRTYPQKHYRFDGVELPVVESMKGWTIIHGVSDLYHAKWVAPERFSTLRTAGKKYHAFTTGIVDDRQIDMTLESHPVIFMKRPEMSIDVTVTVA